MCVFVRSFVQLRCGYFDLRNSSGDDGDGVGVVWCLRRQLLLMFVFLLVMQTVTEGMVSKDIAVPSVVSLVPAVKCVCVCVYFYTVRAPSPPAPPMIVRGLFYICISCMFVCRSNLVNFNQYLRTGNFFHWCFYGRCCYLLSNQNFSLLLIVSLLWLVRNICIGREGKERVGDLFDIF